MIRYLKHSEIDKAKWDDCIEQSENGLIYGLSWYLDIVNPDWEALVMENYEAVFPLTWKKKYTIHYLYQPFFCQKLGLFARNNSTELINEFLLSIPEKFKFIDICLNQKIISKNKNWNCRDRNNEVLDLNEHYETIKKNYNSNLIRNLKKAPKIGLTVAEVNLDDILKLFRKELSLKVKEIKLVHYKVLSVLINKADQKGMLIKKGVLYENKLVAGLLILKWKNRNIILVNPSDETGKKIGAMHFLIDKFIFENAASAQILDLEGSDIPDIARFYKSFGTESEKYYQIKINKLPPLIKFLKK